MKSFFPAGLKAEIPYDTTPFVRVSIKGVVQTLIEAIVLVFVVMYLFLQNFRATIIPTLAVPVVLLGTFGVLAAFGYSINTLTMFGMVLAIGILVDDAIVVVENVERIMAEEGLPPREATVKAMEQVSGAIVGIIGPNGAGKTTLVKTLVGELAPIVGERMAHPDLKIGYFAQHTVESLHEGQSPMEHFREIAPDAPNQSFRDFLGKWNFPGDRAFEPVDGFSGGERARLALALIAWQQPNVLLLDEPTNHLDLEMREALAEALATFEGAIVMVSHDRHLIGLVCDTYWRVADGVVEPFDGDLDAYAAWLRTRPQAQGTKARMEQVEEPVVVKTAPVAQVVQKKPVNPHKLAAAEAKVAELEGALAELDRQLADPANYADATRMAVIGRDRETAAAQLEKADAARMELLES
ncbi:hypothetical protein G6F32_013137 [Rhizopus arrhizus]|nr:hypothetical protein G6F32_013137 [Rhizopus arrhizus]